MGEGEGALSYRRKHKRTHTHTQSALSMSEIEKEIYVLLAFNLNDTSNLRKQHCAPLTYKSLPMSRIYALRLALIYHR